MWSGRSGASMASVLISAVSMLGASWEGGAEQVATRVAARMVGKGRVCCLIRGCMSNRVYRSLAELMRSGDTVLGFGWRKCACPRVQYYFTYMW